MANAIDGLRHVPDFLVILFPNGFTAKQKMTAVVSKFDY
jgi:hypothetical protein